jgi:cytochrome P450
MARTIQIDGEVSAEPGALATVTPLSGPRTPAALQSLSYGLDPYGYFIRSQRRYGDGFLARPFGQRWVVLSDPAAIRELFACGPEDLDSGAANSDLRPILGLRNVLMLDGTEHLHRRRLVLPPLHGGPLRGYEPLIKAAIDRQVEHWARKPRARILPMMQSLTLEVALGAIYGVEDVDAMSRLGTALRRLLSWTTDVRRMLVFGFLGPDRLTNLRGFRRQAAAVDGLVYAEIAARRQDPDLDRRIDVLSVLLRARDEAGDPLSDRDIRDELAVLMIAGHETTAAMLSWGLREIAAHPDVQKQLADGCPGIVDAVVKETLRLHPPVPLGALRVSRKPLRIGGRDYLAGTTFAPCALLLHRRPDLYPAPEEFQPDRFVGQKPGSGEWIPFGGGVRRCLGAALAEMEGRMVFARAAEVLEMSGPRLPPNRIARRGLILVPPPAMRGPRASPRRAMSA